jgi:manganese transport protein
MLGATVMPHNLYLHSALVQTRRIGRTTEDKRRACRYNLLDSTIALNGALLVNAAILILAATVFYKNGVVVTEIQQAHQLLAPLLGTTLASIAFGVALLLSGQSSTMTGTMAGQIVMEGFLHIRMRPVAAQADHASGGHHSRCNCHFGIGGRGSAAAADPEPGRA